MKNPGKASVVGNEQLKDLKQARTQDLLVPQLLARPDLHLLGVGDHLFGRLGRRDCSGIGQQVRLAGVPLARCTTVKYSSQSPWNHQLMGMEI
jgi:hypothetical protein